MGSNSTESPKILKSLVKGKKLANSDNLQHTQLGGGGGGGWRASSSDQFTATAGGGGRASSSDQFTARCELFSCECFC